MPKKIQVPLVDLKAQHGPLRDDILTAMGEVLDSASFCLGPAVTELESYLQNYLSVDQAWGVGSGSDALILALRAAGIGPGDEVLMPTYTFFATGGSVRHTGARPVFVDVEPDSFNIDVTAVRQAITPQTKAILPVHLFGRCANMGPLQELCREHNLALIEDAAQALGSDYQGQMAGTIGDVGCFSFFPTKVLGACGEGGMVTTNDPKLSEALRILRIHGAENQYHHTLVGYNSRLDSMQAAALGVKIKHLENWIEARRANAAFYREGLAGLSGVSTPAHDPVGRHIYSQYVIRVERRDELKDHLQSVGVGSAVYYPVPLHLQDCFVDLGYAEGDFPEAEQASKDSLALPVYPELGMEQKEYVVASIRSFYGEK